MAEETYIKKIRDCVQILCERDELVTPVAVTKLMFGRGDLSPMDTVIDIANIMNENRAFIETTIAIHSTSGAHGG